MPPFGGTSPSIGRRPKTHDAGPVGSSCASGKKSRGGSPESTKPRNMNSPSPYARMRHRRSGCENVTGTAQRHYALLADPRSDGSRYSAVLSLQDVRGGSAREGRLRAVSCRHSEGRLTRRVVAGSCPTASGRISEIVAARLGFLNRSGLSEDPTPERKSYDQQDHEHAMQNGWTGLTTGGSSNFWAISTRRSARTLSRPTAD